MELLRVGADISILGQTKANPNTSPAAIARISNMGSPGLADLVDAEARLRQKDPERMAKLRSGAIGREEFSKTLKAENAAGGGQT